MLVVHHSQVISKYARKWRDRIISETNGLLDLVVLFHVFSQQH